MASLRDQSFNREAWTKLGLVALAVLAVAGLIAASVQAHHHWIEVPRLLEARHQEPVGTPGHVTTGIRRLGSDAVETLADDLVQTGALSGDQRKKSLELLSGIDDQRVLPLLEASLRDADPGMRVTAIAAIVRHRRPEGAEALWKVADGDMEFLRHRAIVGLGVIGRASDRDRLLARAAAAQGADRVLWTWAAGQALRRPQDVDQVGRLPPAPLPDDDAVLERLQADIEAMLVEIDAAPPNADVALRFARATAVEYGTWDYAHQIGYQTLAVGGPLAIRSGVRGDDRRVKLIRRAAPADAGRADGGGAVPAAPPAPALGAGGPSPSGAMDAGVR